jgi:hypothetical protein
VDLGNLRDDIHTGGYTTLQDFDVVLCLFSTQQESKISTNNRYSDRGTEENGFGHSANQRSIIDYGTLTAREFETPHHAN